MSFEKIIKLVSINNHSRNRKKRIEVATKNNDLYNFIIKNKIKPKKILEIGCSTGYILEALRREIKSRCYGIDTSKTAIDEGKKLFKNISLRQGFFETSSLSKKKYDLIICGFFLFMLPPNKVLNLFNKIDYSLQDKGYVLIYDFSNNLFKLKKYKHDKRLKVYRWDYKKIFQSLPYYNTVRVSKIYKKQMKDFIEMSLLQKRTIK